MRAYYNPPGQPLAQKPRIISATPLLVQPLQQWIGALPHHARQIARPCLSCKLNPLIAPWSSCTFNPATEGGVVMVIKAPHGWHEHDFSLGPAGAWNLLFSSFWELLRILWPGMPSHLQEWGVWMQNSRPSTWWGTRVLLQIQWFESHLDLGVLQEGQTLIIASFRPPLHTSPIKNIQESTFMNCHPDMWFLPHVQFRFASYITRRGSARVTPVPCWLVLPGRCELLFSCAMPTCLQRDGSDLREQWWCGLLHAQGPDIEESELSQAQKDANRNNHP